MGAKISIDKHVSNLHELLEMSAQYFQKVKFESKISGDLTQHLKVIAKNFPSNHSSLPYAVESASRFLQFALMSEEIMGRLNIV